MCISQKAKRRPLPFAPKLNPLKNHVISASNVEKNINTKKIIESHWYKPPSPPIVVTDQSLTKTPITPTSSTLSSSTSVAAASTSESASNAKDSSNDHHKNPHHIVQHDYHDHANDVELKRIVTKTAKPVARGGVTTPFPVKLHDMLDKIEEDGLAHVISWQPHGRCFVVHKPKEFVDHVMPTYFKQSKFASFQRQLNLYGFLRLTKGNDKGGYYHESFLRGKGFLTHKIQRMKVKGTGVRARSNPDTEPNFYQMKPCLKSGELISQATFEKLPDIPSSAMVENNAENDNKPSASKSTITPLPQQPAIKQEESIPSAVHSSVSSESSHRGDSSSEDDDDDDNHFQRCSLDRDDDDLMLFEGKQFHYLDPLARASTASQIAISPRPQELVSLSPIPVPVATAAAAVPSSNAYVQSALPSMDASPMDDDPFSKDEMEDFLSDLNLPKSLYDDIMETVDDDTAFGYLLERIIE